MPCPANNQVFIDSQSHIELTRETFQNFYQLKLENPNSFGAFNCMKELPV